MSSEIIALALEAGFEHAAAFAADELVFSPEVRAMCASGRCRRYGKCWSCPPACGPIEALERRARKFSRCVLVQTVARLDGDFDAEGPAVPLSRQALAEHGGLRPAGQRRLPQRGAGVLPRPRHNNVFILYSDKLGGQNHVHTTRDFP